MRLICPNCGAQYEVDDAVIPDQGRDVQCSNCGHTWFQRPAHMDADLSEELEEAGLSGAASEEPEEPKPEVEDNEPKRRGLDPDVADVLREEAARETEARRAEAEGLESQPDLGLDEAAAAQAASRSAAARARMARMRGVAEGNPDAEAAVAGLAAAAAGRSRKEMVPDVEEINTSLGSSGGPGEGDGSSTRGDGKKTKSKSGFGRGFLYIIVLLLIAIAVYVFAPQIVQYVPAAEPYMIAYVEFANNVRDQINAGVDKIADLVRGLIGG